MSIVIPVPEVVVPDQFNAATAFLDRNLSEGHADKIAIYYEDQTYTYYISNPSIHMTSVSWSPNSRQIAVASSDNMVRIWNVGGWGAAAKAPTQPIVSHNTGYSDLNGEPASHSVACHPMANI